MQLLTMVLSVGDQRSTGPSGVAAQSSDRLYAVAVRFLRDTDAASDALQAALVQIWRDLPTLRDPERFDAWSYRVVLNCCRAQRRRANHLVTTLDLTTAEAVETDSQVAVAMRDELERAFRALPDDQRAVLVLLYYRDLSVEDIATTLGISPGTVKSRLYYARLAMRAAIEADARPIEREGRAT
jgi:RNA polymerase sigma-70 factor (ECF subfamily)